MAIVIKTSRPDLLLQAIKDKIDENEIRTWGYDEDGDFTHTPDQWNNQAWLRPDIGFGVLKLGILGPEKVGVQSEIYGIYHGRFIEMLLNHFDQEFEEVKATAVLTHPDLQ